MDKYKQTRDAMALFGLNESETVHSIKSKISNRIREWHPDTGNREAKESKEHSIRLIEARQLILDYIENYPVSFKKEDVKRHLSPEELWQQQFGNDPLWGSGENR
ncbi:MAG: hypothetical protein JW969_16065 [Spirochaetales bacterium]|nr:hypothetical protein [Spirochaetales bacterium]